MEKRSKGDIRSWRKVSHICLLLLALLQITPSSAQNTTSTTNATTTTTPAPSPAALRYLTRPADLKVAVGEPAVFRCGVSKAYPNLTFTFYGSNSKYILNCPNGDVENIAQALYGHCDVTKEESLAVWTLKGTSFSDNGTKVVCQQSKNPDASAAVLHVYDNGISHAILIGCSIGGFFGVVLVAGLSYTMLKRSETLQECFRGKETEEDDIDTIVSKE